MARLVVNVPPLLALLVTSALRIGPVTNLMLTFAALLVQLRTLGVRFGVQLGAVSARIRPSPGRRMVGGVVAVLAVASLCALVLASLRRCGGPRRERGRGGPHEGTDQPAHVDVGVGGRARGGVVTLVSGETFCTVRVSDRVSLHPDTARDGVVETVIADARDFVTRPLGC